MIIRVFDVRRLWSAQPQCLSVLRGGGGREQGTVGLLGEQGIGTALGENGLLDEGDLLPGPGGLLSLLLRPLPLDQCELADALLFLPLAVCLLLLQVVLLLRLGVQLRLGLGSRIL